MICKSFKCGLNATNLYGRDHYSDHNGTIVMVLSVEITALATVLAIVLATVMGEVVQLLVVKAPRRVPATTVVNPAIG